MVGRQFTHAFAAGLIIASTVTSALRAQNLLERLVVPGPVVSGHAKYEKECSNCHEPFSKKSQTRLCLACHKETAADRQSKKGFHGRQTDAAKQECTICHTDHKGRDADIVLLDLPSMRNHPENRGLVSAWTEHPSDGETARPHADKVVSGLPERKAHLPLKGRRR